MIEKIHKFFKNRIFLIIILSLMVFLVVFILRGLFVSLDKTIIYGLIDYKNKINNFNASKDIVVVEIDDKSIKQIGNFPFSRNVYTKFINKLTKANVSIIAFDIILSDNGPDKEVDNELAKSIRDSNKVVLGAPIYSDLGIIKLDVPLEKFRENSLGYGFYNPKINKKTNSVYSFYASLELINFNTNKKELFNNFNIEIIKNFLHINENPEFLDDKIRLGKDILIPYSHKGSKDVLINYLVKKKFRHMSFSDIILNNVNITDLENKIVLLGYTAQGMKDTFNTPNGIDFGVYVHANIINTILQAGYIKYFDDFLEWVLIFLLIIVAIYFNFSKNNRLILLSNFAIFFIFIILPFLVLSLSNINLILNHPTSILLAYILSITLSNIVKFIIENKNKKKLLKAVSEYVSKDIARKILSGKGDIILDGDKKNISIFFSDIAGFTTISEKMDAVGLVEFLREYLGTMSSIILDDHGFINKYEGDAIMALFGIFSYEDTSNYDNCKTALLQQQSLKRLNVLWKEKYGEILQVRMGLHFGEAIIGNIGAVGRKMEFTALGDSVNLASRLEGVNKFYGTNICVSETVYEDQKENFEFRKLDRIVVKGKKNAIMIYELLDFQGRISDLKKDIVKKYEEALELYFEGRFNDASKIFKELGNLGDKPSLIFTRRCLHLEIKYEANVPRDWDGVWEFNEK